MVKIKDRLKNDCEMKTVNLFKGPENRQELVQTRLRSKKIVQREMF